MRRCIFCDQQAKTSEHVWPKWLTSFIGSPLFGRTARIVRRGQKTEIKTWSGSEVKIRHVCKGCNEKWMSDLESEARPTVIALASGTMRSSLNRKQATTLATWATKTAMVRECVDADPTNYPTTGKRFYAFDECLHLRHSLTPPSNTIVWLGRATRFDSLFTHGAGANFSVPGHEVEAYCATFAFRRLVLQVFGLRITPPYKHTVRFRFNTNDAARGFLLQLWPTDGSESTPWPTLRAFAGRASLDALAVRYNSVGFE